MFQSLSFLCTSSAILLSILAIYSIICEIQIGVTIYKLKGAEGSADAEKTVTEHTRFNIYMWLARKLSKGNSSKLKRKTKSTFDIVLAMIYIFIRSALISFFIALGFMTLDNAFNALPSILYNITSKHEDCECYAKCTGDPEDDKKTAYELIFGPTEYEKLVNDMLYTCTAKEKEEFEEINAGDDGAAKSQFIQAHINDQMVADYKSLVGQNRRFKSNDGKHRYEMNDDELRDDLIQLFKDVKTNGRNLQCPHCSSINSSYLYLQCEGMKHWKPGWSWDDLWTDPDEPSTPGGAHNPPGNATGKYAVELEDGTHWYWYHQNNWEGASCGYNVMDPVYGNLWNLTIGSSGGGNNNTMHGAGCSMYSTAMAMSNLLDEEYTPYRVIQELMGCSISDGGGTYIFYPDKEVNGIGRHSGGMHYNYSKMAELINAKFGSLGMHAEAKAFTQENVDECIASSDHYGMVINSWTGGFSWYNGTGHFMVIRKKGSDGKYYCLSSSGSTAYGYSDSGIKNLMSTGCEFSTVSSHIAHSSCLFITMDKSYYEQGGGEGSGTLTGPITVGGISGYLWKPDNITSSTGLIWCMPGWSESPETVKRNAAYISVESGLVKPANAVFFADYTKINADNGKYDGNEIDSTSLGNAISELRSSYLQGCGNNLYYYGFSWGAYRFGGGTGGAISGMQDWKEAMLGDGGNVSGIVVGNLQRVVVTQATENHVTEYDNKFNSLGSNYKMVNMRDTTTSHATANYYTASNSADTFKSMTPASYYNASLPAPSYGLTWFTGGSAGGGGGGGTIPSSEEVKQALLNSGTGYATKADLLSKVYAVTEPEYGVEMACGIMANFYCEGSPGLIEGAFYLNHQAGFNLDSSHVKMPFEGKYSRRVGDEFALNYMETFPTSPHEYSCGFGMGQYSYGRRVSLAKAYHEYVTDFNSLDQHYSAEISYYLDEIHGGTKYGHSELGAWNNAIAKMGEGTSSEQKAYNAGYGICQYYERPQATDPATGRPNKEVRGDHAVAIYNIIKDVGTGGNTGTTLTANWSDLRPFVMDLYKCYNNGTKWNYGSIPPVTTDKLVTNSNRKLSNYASSVWVCDTTSSRLAYLLGETDKNYGNKFVSDTKADADSINLKSIKHGTGTLGEYWLIEPGDPNITKNDLRPGDIIVWYGHHAATVVYNSGTSVSFVHSGGTSNISDEFDHGCMSSYQCTGSLYSYCDGYKSQHAYLYVFRSNNSGNK